MNAKVDKARQVALIVPLLLVNAAAIYGQVSWAYDHLTIDGRPSWPVAVLFALALESVGVYLAAEAHAAQMAGDSAARLRWMSYAVATLAGALNYAHFADRLTDPTPQAVAFAALSMLSPWLWAIRSRSMSRAQLRADGLIDGRAVKFTAAQWLLYPVWSFKAFRGAVWLGETDPAVARALFEARPSKPSKRDDAVVDQVNEEKNAEQAALAAEFTELLESGRALTELQVTPYPPRPRLGGVRRRGRAGRLAGRGTPRKSLQAPATPAPDRIPAAPPVRELTVPPMRRDIVPSIVDAFAAGQLVVTDGNQIVPAAGTPEKATAVAKSEPKREQVTAPRKPKVKKRGGVAQSSRTSADVSNEKAVALAREYWVAETSAGRTPSSAQIADNSGLSRTSAWRLQKKLEREGATA